MAKSAIVYWSGTGNTEAMANAVAEGAKAAGIDVDMFQAADFTPDLLPDYEAVAFGCPSMGVEVLEETEMQPMWDDVKPELGGKRIALFGSYGWGDGEWMRNWADEAEGAGAVLVADYVICNDAPNDDAVAACQALGASLK